MPRKDTPKNSIPPDAHRQDAVEWGETVIVTPTVRKLPVTLKESGLWIAEIMISDVVGDEGQATWQVRLDVGTAVFGLLGEGHSRSENCVRGILTAKGSAESLRVQSEQAQDVPPAR